MCRPIREQAQLLRGIGGGRRSGDQPSTLWELSLLAKAVCQVAGMLDVPAPSRASSAPTGDWWRDADVVN
ncbi:hypothetical protein C9I50_21985 [Pseudomonas prosekii]|nr:hypothetical protein C9I50_21985 [Pseudomonas prosekii]